MNTFVISNCSMNLLGELISASGLFRSICFIHVSPIHHNTSHRLGPAAKHCTWAGHSDLQSSTKAMGILYVSRRTMASPVGFLQAEIRQVKLQSMKNSCYYGQQEEMGLASLATVGRCQHPMEVEKSHDMGQPCQPFKAPWPWQQHPEQVETLLPAPLTS